MRDDTRTPTLCVYLIVKNEARDLPRCVASVKPIADHIIVVDTGSTDDTMKIAADLGCDVYRYTDASELIDGQWRIADFSAARNYALQLAEQTSCTWLCWFDGDDELTTPQALRRAMHLDAFDAYDAWIEDHGQRWIHCRMWRNGKAIRFAGAVHEYPVLDGLRRFTLDDCTIRHHSEPSTGQEDSNARNLRLLLGQWERTPDARTAFYLACTHRDGGRNAEAVEWFEKRIAMGKAVHPHEWLFAHLYGARCARLCGDFAKATDILDRALAEEDAWAEFHVERAWCAYGQGRYEEAISYCVLVRYPSLMPIPVTHLWREPDKYRDQPLRLMSWCYEHLGRLKPALAYAEAAAREIQGNDVDWNARSARLHSLIERGPNAPAVVVQKIEAIALCRPGAIGDILMTLNLIPALTEASPGLKVHYFCDARYGAMDALGSTMRAAGVDVIMDCGRADAWRGRYERWVDLVGYPLHEGYPEKPMQQHLLRYFANEMAIASAATPGLPALTLRRPARPLAAPEGDYATLQWRAGWSRYKQWPADRWAEVQSQLRADIPIVMIDEDEGRTLAYSIALVANARMHLGIDSFCNHLTNYYWTDRRGGRKVLGVILWGSTQASAAGYPDNINLSAGFPCSPCFREDPKISRMDRGPCVNVVSVERHPIMWGTYGREQLVPATSYDDPRQHACMEAIAVDQVVDAVRRLWERTK